MTTLTQTQINQLVTLGGKNWNNSRIYFSGYQVFSIVLHRNYYGVVQSATACGRSVNVFTVQDLKNASCYVNVSTGEWVCSKVPAGFEKAAQNFGKSLMTMISDAGLNASGEIPF